MGTWEEDAPRTRREILAVREAYNDTNPDRTDYP